MTYDSLPKLERTQIEGDSVGSSHTPTQLMGLQQSALQPACRFGVTCSAAPNRLYIGTADGMSIARVWALRGGRFEYRHAHTRAVDVPSAMPR